MLEIFYINDIDDPRISLYKSLRFTPKTHQDKRLFLAEGRRLVIKLLKTNIPIYSIFATNEFIKENEDLIIKRKNKDTEIFSSDKTIMEKIIGFHLHTGVMALAYQPLDVVTSEMKGTIVAANGINNAENIGSIIRNMVGFGIENLVVDFKSASPFLRRAVRVSMGSVFFCNVCHSANLLNEIIILKNRGYKIIGIEIHDNSKIINNYIFDNISLLIFGSEDKGLDNEIIEQCNDLIKIPMSDKLDSLNVSSSSAVVFYEMSRNKHI